MSRPKRTVWPVIPQEEWPRSLADQAKEMGKMAMTEAGYPLEPYWNEAVGAYFVAPSAPQHVLDRMRVLVFERLGIEYEVRERGA